MSGKLPQEPRWKDKIDPAFDKIIKFYIQFVDFVGLPANEGWIGLEGEALELWEKKGMQGWIRPFEKNMTTEKNTIMKWKIPKTVTEEEKNKAKRTFEKWLLEEIEILPEDSQNYYRRSFAPFYSEAISDDFFRNMTMEELKEFYTDFVTDQFVLSVHRGMLEIEKEIKNSPEEMLKKRYFRQSTIFSMLISSYNSISLLVFDRSFVDLIKQARNGDEDSFFKALRIDRTIVECDWVQKMIRKAQLTGDNIFFDRMAKAVSKKPLDNAKVFTRARMVILLFWDLGIRKLIRELKYHEVRKLLKGCGLQVQESDAFRKFMRDLEKVVYKRDIVTFSKDTPTS